jgi:hypothetical protein
MVGLLPVLDGGTFDESGGALRLSPGLAIPVGAGAIAFDVADHHPEQLDD